MALAASRVMSPSKGDAPETRMPVRPEPSANGLSAKGSSSVSVSSTVSDTLIVPELVKLRFAPPSSSTPVASFTSSITTSPSRIKALSLSRIRAGPALSSVIEPWEPIVTSDGVPPSPAVDVRTGAVKSSSIVTCACAAVETLSAINTAVELSKALACVGVSAVKRIIGFPFRLHGAPNYAMKRGPRMRTL